MTENRTIAAVFRELSDLLLKEFSMSAPFPSTVRFREELEKRAEQLDPSLCEACGVGQNEVHKPECQVLAEKSKLGLEYFR